MNEESYQMEMDDQAQFNHSTHKWTVWTKQGLERTFSDVVSYARYMTRGY